MPAGEEGQECVVDDLRLSDHDPADLLDQSLSPSGQVFDRGYGDGGLVWGIHWGEERRWNQGHPEPAMVSTATVQKPPRRNHPAVVPSIRIGHEGGC